MAYLSKSIDIGASFSLAQGMLVSKLVRLNLLSPLIECDTQGFSKASLRSRATQEQRL